MHLPHYAVTSDDRTRSTSSRGSRSICRSRIPSPRRGTASSTCSCGCRRPASRAGDILLADSTIFTTLFGGDESLRELLEEPRHEVATMPALELDDIQSGVLRPRPTPFAATYIIFRIDDRAAGRELMRRLSDVVAVGGSPGESRRAIPGSAWRSRSRASSARRSAGVARQLSPQFRARHGGARARVGRRRRERSRALGEAARHARRSRRAHGRVDQRRRSFEAAVGARAKHAATVARHRSNLAAGLPRAHRRKGAVRFQGRHQPSGDRRQRHSRNQSARSSTARPASSCSAIPTRSSDTPLVPQPDVLGRNGSYVVFRKLHQRVAAFRRYLSANAAEPQTRSCSRQR